MSETENVEPATETPRVPGYAKSIHVDHRGAAQLFEGDAIVIQEKVDGSQFSFMVDDEWNLLCRSNKCQVPLYAPHMFTQAVEHLKTVKDRMVPGWVYRGEYLRSPKHNSLKYDRVPRGTIVLWDVMVAPENYLAPDLVAKEAVRLGLDVVPTFHAGPITREEFHAKLPEWLKTPPVLGGAMIEGVVVKNYARFNDIDRRILFAKYVTDAFKEIHSKSWRLENPHRKDVVQGLVEALATDARFLKAVQKGREAGVINGRMNDLAFLCKEIPRDIQEEAKDFILEHLWRFFWPQINRMVANKIPPWYKEQLAREAAPSEIPADVTT